LCPDHEQHSYLTVLEINAVSPRLVRVERARRAGGARAG
jgi:hypothetical protein